MSLATTEFSRPAEPGLDALLAGARHRSAEFPDALANHLPMILVALDRLGAGPERQADFFARYDAGKGLVPLSEPIAALDEASWPAILGDRRREADARRFFTDVAARRGIARAVSDHLPRLAPGVAGSALHPLMRLAYAILRDDPAEVGAALGYWACCYLALPPSRGLPPETDDPGIVLARVAAMPGLRALPAYDHLWHAIRAAAADPDFQPVVDWLRIDETTMARVAATALALYAATMDFAALHAVTGAHWVRLVAQVCPDPMLLRSFWQAVAALVPAIGFPALPSPEELDAMRRVPCPDWPPIMRAAVASDDEHDISLVFSASEEEKVYRDPLYRVVAARRVGLIA